MNNIKSISIQKKEKGFTIIEVLIAIVIFSVGVLAVAKMQIHALDANKKAFDQTEATMWASNQAETIVSQPFASTPLLAGDYGPAFADPANRYSLTWKITNNGLTTKTIAITVSWTEKGVQKSLEFDYIKAAPIL